LKILLTSIGSRGDVQPMLAIAQALAARGHHPVIAAPPDFGDWVRGFGFEFAPLGIDVNAFMQEHRATLGGNIWKFFRVVRGMFDRDLPDQMAALLELGRDADAIVHAAGAAMAPSAAEKLGIPALNVFFTTTVLPSRHHAPVVVPWRTLPKWMNALLWLATDPMWNMLLRKGMNAGRERAGLRPLRDVVTHLFDDASHVLAVDSGILPSDPRWAARVPSVGFLFLQPKEIALEADLDNWLREGEPPVYVGFGSMTGTGPERMHRVMVEAIEATGRRGLVSAGWARFDRASFPAGWRVVGDTAHALLFPRMACVIHHGGSGTMAAALRAGVPQVIAPLILDQYHHAQRLHELGLAPRPVPMERITAPQLAESIRWALAASSAPRERVADRLRRSDAAGEIARRAEEMAAAR